MSESIHDLLKCRDPQCPDCEGRRRFEIYRIAETMAPVGTPAGFAIRAAELACEWEGIRDLLFLWRDTTEDDPERVAIIGSIQELFDDIDRYPGIRTRSTRDPETEARYLYLNGDIEAGGSARQQKIDVKTGGTMVLDFDQDGALLGIEFLDVKLRK